MPVEIVAFGTLNSSYKENFSGICKYFIQITNEFITHIVKMSQRTLIKY